MATLIISDDDLNWIETRSQGGDAAGYIQALIARDREDALADLLEEGEASGISPRSFEDIVAATRSRSSLGEG